MLASTDRTNICLALARRCGGGWEDSRVAVRQLVVALVGLHGEFEVACLTGEAGLVPGLWEGVGQGSVLTRSGQRVNIEIGL